MGITEKASFGMDVQHITRHLVLMDFMSDTYRHSCLTDRHGISLSVESHTTDVLSVLPKMGLGQNICKEWTQVILCLSSDMLSPTARPTL